MSMGSRVPVASPAGFCIGELPAEAPLGSGQNFLWIPALFELGSSPFTKQPTPATTEFVTRRVRCRITRRNAGQQTTNPTGRDASPCQLAIPHSLPRPTLILAASHPVPPRRPPHPAGGPVGPAPGDTAWPQAGAVSVGPHHPDHRSESYVLLNSTPWSTFSSPKRSHQ